MAFIQSDYNWGNIKRLILKRQQTEEVPLTPSLRHCSNKYKLAREGEKEKDEDLESVFFLMMKSSRVVFKEMSFSVVD